MGIRRGVNCAAQAVRRRRLKWLGETVPPTEFTRGLTAAADTTGAGRLVDLVTGTGNGHRMRVIPCDEIQMQGRGIECSEQSVNLAAATTARSEYAGMVYRPRLSRSYFGSSPVFVKEV